MLMRAKVVACLRYAPGMLVCSTARIQAKAAISTSMLALLHTLMSWTHSFIPRRKRRLLLSVLVTAAVLLTWRWCTAAPAASTAKHVLITTPGNTTYPFHRLSTSDWTPTPLRVAFDDAFFPTHVIAHSLAQDIYLVTNEVDRGSIIAVRLDGDNVIVVGRLDSGGGQPAHCAIVGDNLICVNVSHTSYCCAA